ncbi:hypothetical protein [Streptomyces indiaensis]|uniref:Uncharacterized protein n=1 Tax=Streptomyces indiaensis TaxID=284033 RepID=A0ABP5RDC1_9ACTN|nr:hypothetical protein [Streptomyces indiaensis]MCF1643808.1 hypothetical protein [Streptomyces indiaensis]
MSRWEGALDLDRAERTLDGEDVSPPDDGEERSDGELKGTEREFDSEALASAVPAQKSKGLEELKEPAPESG